MTILSLLDCLDLKVSYCNVALASEVITRVT